MADTFQIERQKFIGATDVAALFGVDDWKSATDVYCEKIGVGVMKEQTEVMKKGILLEPFLAEYFRKHFITKDQTLEYDSKLMFIHSDIPDIGVHPDAILFENGEPVAVVEFKLTGQLMNPARFNTVEEWLKNDRPSWFFQGQTVLEVFRSKGLNLPFILFVFIDDRSGNFHPLLDKNGQPFKMMSDERTQKAIKIKVKQFVDNHLTPKIPPSDEESTVFKTPDILPSVQMTIDSKFNDVIKKRQQLHRQMSTIKQQIKDIDFQLKPVLDTFDCVRINSQDCHIVKIVNEGRFFLDPKKTLPLLDTDKMKELKISLGALYTKTQVKTKFKYRFYSNEDDEGDDESDD